MTFVWEVWWYQNMAKYSEGEAPTWPVCGQTGAHPNYISRWVWGNLSNFVTVVEIARHGNESNTWAAWAKAELWVDVMTVSLRCIAKSMYVYIVADLMVRKPVIFDNYWNRYVWCSRFRFFTAGIPPVIAALLWSRAQRHWVGLELRFGCVLMAELHGLLRSTVCHV